MGLKNDIVYRAVLRRAWKDFGQVTQLAVFLEELGELSQAIAKKLRFMLFTQNLDDVPDEDPEAEYQTRLNWNILEEAADVQICLDQIKTMIKSRKKRQKEDGTEEIDVITFDRLHEVKFTRFKGFYEGWKAGTKK